MNYKLKNVNIQLNHTPNKDASFTEALSLDVSPILFTRAYSKLFKEEYVADYFANDVKIPFMVGIGDSLVEIAEYDDDFNPNIPFSIKAFHDLDYINSDSLYEMAIILKLISDSQSHDIGSTFTLRLNYTHIYEVYFLISLVEKLDLDDAVASYDHWTTPANITNIGINAIRLTRVCGNSHLLTNDYIEELCNFYEYNYSVDVTEEFYNEQNKSTK